MITVWIIIALIGGQLHTGAFPDKAACMEKAAIVEAAMAEDGPNDGDAISGCLEVQVRPPARSP